MRSKIINGCLSLIRKNNDYDEIKLLEIKYGLESIYILITKSIIIFSIAYLLGILKELLLFILFYNFVRMPSFGLHATKSWICLVSSLIIFIAIPFLCKLINLNQLQIAVIGVISIILLFKNSPADTVKRPIVNKKRRLAYRLITTFIAITYVNVALNISNNYIANIAVMSLVLQCFMTSPLVYRTFKLPYNNYKSYIPSLS